jgi:hypothetical protein
MSGERHIISEPDYKADYETLIAACQDATIGFHKRLVGIIRIVDDGHSVWFRVTSNGEIIDESQNLARAIRLYNGL